MRLILYVALRGQCLEKVVLGEEQFSLAALLNG